MNNDVVAEIKKRINIVDFISGYITLKKRGKSYIGLCPFHKEKTGSFNVNPDKGFYKCFGCGESGDIFTFLQKYENIDFFDALKILADKAGVQIESNEINVQKKSEKDEIYLANGYAVQFYKNNLKTNSQALSYLSRRGISPEAIEKFSLGFSSDNWNELANFLKSKNINANIGIKAGLLKQSDNNTVYDMFRNRIMYPIWTSFGKPIGFGGRIMTDEKPKYINTAETPVFNKGKEFYGFNFAKEAISKYDQVIIVEGYMDVIACHSHGIENVIAVLGTALTIDHIQKISRYTKNIIMCFDADAAGIRAALKNGALFLQEGIQPLVAVTPKGEDPDSFLRNGKRSDFINIIDNAKGLLDFEIDVCLEEFDLTNQNDKVNALISACKIVAKEPNSIRRDAYIKRLIFLHPNPEATNAQDDIRTEINKNLSNVVQTTNVKSKIKAINRDKYVLVQKIILSGMCNGIYDLNGLKNLETDDFELGFNQNLFSLLKDFVIKGEAPNLSYIESYFRNNNLVDEFFDLLSIDESYYKNSLENLIDILLVKRNKSKVTRRQQLEQKLAEGNLSHEEYSELMLILRGK